ncbi:HAD family hydrolase [Paenibacillus harenae]|uniref:HAD family hydrolase n=1 Tax=Paenibacillus harenae TaxID=306543 RepID=UPI00279018AF|nr:HAD-IA family hydrolase [Paenibacillus harenae]MDQ0062239.1 putative hydrolase of the HAD superfamily [Paenibacillus harenae]
MIKAVLFDLDLTLLDRDVSVERFVSHQYDRYYAALQHIPREVYAAAFIELDAGGYVWKDIVYEQLVRQFGIENITPAELLDDYVAQFHKSCVPYPGLKAMLDTLKTEGYALGLITNAIGDFQQRNIEAIGIEPYFDVILISGWEGVKKPHPDIFLRALDKLGVEPEDSVYIGDHPLNDVEAARHVGMKGIWKSHTRWEQPAQLDGVVHDLIEIPALISRL